MTYSSKKNLSRPCPSLDKRFFFSERRSKAFTLHTPHFTLHIPHFTLLTHFTLHTALFTPHTSHWSKPTCNKKTLVPKWRKSANKSISQPSCSHSNTIYEIQLQKTIVLRMQPQHEATLTQPVQCDLQRQSCKTHQNYAQRRQHSPIRRYSALLRYSVVCFNSIIQCN